MLIRDPYHGIPLGVECAWPASRRPDMTTIDLQRGRLLRLRESAGSTLTARAGEVWITEQDNPRDVLLRPGQSFTLGRSGLALVEAFSDASIALSN
jgi:hypothetical protein